VSPMTTFLILFALGAAAVAFWTAVRFPNFGPSRLETAVCCMAAATVGLGLIPIGISTVLSLEMPYGQLVAVFGVGFSGFVFLFLSGAWFVRLIQNSLQGFMG
jgi:hypothetical protein